MSNLQRQIIHGTADVGKAKVKSAKETMNAMNSDVVVNTYREFVTSENIMDLIADYDFIIDGTDNFPAKFLINDACVMAKKPFSHAGIIRFMFREKDHATAVSSRIRLRRMLFRPVNRLVLSVQWAVLSEVCRQWKQLSI